LDFVISMWILHSIFLSIITPRYFTCFTEWMYRPLNVRSASIGLVDVRNRRHVLSFIIKYQRSHNNSNEMKQRCHFSTPSVPYMQVSSAKICRWMRKVWSITYKQPLRNGGRWGTLCYLCLYESRLRSSWTRLITPSRNFVEVPRNRTGRHLECLADVLMAFHRSTFPKSNTGLNSDLAPCDFWAFRTKKRELRDKKFRSDQLSAARFREVGGAL
jgi:hypothetical protein